MDETALLIFMGYLRALRVIDIAYDADLETYVERVTGKPVGEIVREFLRDMGKVQKSV